MNMSDQTHKEVKSKYVLLAIIITSTIMSIPVVYANIVEFNPYFLKPNVELKLDENNAVIIPDNVGHLNKQYDHEEFASLLQLENERAEKIRDKLIFSAIKDSTDVIPTE